MAGWYDFVNGQALPASQVQDYLMDQSVMVFADEAARNAALGDGTDGMTVYLVNRESLYNLQDGVWVQLLDTTNAASLLATYVPTRSNAILNSAFDIWQRGTSFTSPSFSAYTADRWKNNNYDFAPTTYSVTRETFTPGTVPATGVTAQYFYRSTITTVGSNTQYDTAQQRIEDVSAFAGSTITISFYAKADSARTVKLGAGQSFGSGGSGGVTISNYALEFNLTTSWQRFTATIAVPSITGKTVGAGSFLWFAFRQASASGSVLDLWGVQLEAGNVATPFARATGTLQGELAACQRYYYRSAPGTTYGVHANGHAYSTVGMGFYLKLPVTMRVTPTSVESSSASTLCLYDGTSRTALSASPTIDTSFSTPDMGYANVAVASGLTATRTYAIQNNNSSTAYVAFGAEL